MNSINMFQALLQDRINVLSGANILRQIMASLSELEYYIAGGSVRDFYINSDSTVKDIDIFISDTTAIQKESFCNFITDLKSNGNIVYGPFGSPRWFPSKSEKFYYDIIPFSNFNVGLGTCGTITDILHQFDFTANAIGYNLKNFTFYNPVNGFEDINNKAFRAVRLDFPDRYVSDKIELSKLSVLWFRYMHYSSMLNFTIEPDTLSWIRNNSYRIKDIAIFRKYFFSPIINTNIL